MHGQSTGFLGSSVCLPMSPLVQYSVKQRLSQRRHEQLQVSIHSHCPHCAHAAPSPAPTHLCPAGAPGADDIAASSQAGLKKLNREIYWERTVVPCLTTWHYEESAAGVIVFSANDGYTDTLGLPAHRPHTVRDKGQRCPAKDITHLRRAHTFCSARSHRGTYRT
eukprot:605522-Pelagomonas_calceolata.AAC.2